MEFLVLTVMSLKLWAGTITKPKLMGQQFKHKELETEFEH